jgi:hypothetical protein
MGVNYEVFGRLPYAIACYDLAFRYPVTRPASYKNLVLRKAQCLMTMGRTGDAVKYLTTMIDRAPTPAIRNHLKQAQNAIRRRNPGIDM